MKTALRERAMRLRKQGWSYNIITAQLGVTKSTLSHWLREVPYIPNKEVQKRIQRGPAKSGMLSHQKRMRRISEIKESSASELGTLTARDIWMLGLGVYIGEGSKLYEYTRIINANPDVIRIAVRWLREVCGVKTENLSLAIHLYPDVSEKSALSYWSKVSGIPLSQFGKTQTDIRTNKSGKKQRMLPYGTAHLSVRACGEEQCGVSLHRRILGWIEAAYAQLRV